MNDIAAPLSWIDANQLYLCAEFARLKKRLDPEAPAAAQIDAARDAMPGEAAIDVLAGDFGLTRFERDVLLLCAAVEMDSSLAELCAGSGARRDRGCATFGIAPSEFIGWIDGGRVERILVNQPYVAAAMR